jgi:hypothetical protein
MLRKISADKNLAQSIAAKFYRGDCFMPQAVRYIKSGYLSNGDECK